MAASKKPDTSTQVKKASTGAKKKPAAKRPAGPRTQDLVIVESPAKAKTINKYLGSSFRVLASYGHVRDLADRKAKDEDIEGVRIGDGWLARYVVADKDKKKGKSAPKTTNRRTAKDILAELKKEADKSNRVFLASDPDREGESIAWHIADELKLEDERTFRITFNEITKSAVQRAVDSPGKIHMDRVKAQEARRILDRVVGFPLSKLLGKKVAPGLSAGRVQSVAVRVIVEREYEIEKFVSEEYWKLTAMLSPRDLVKGYAPDPKRAKLFAKSKKKDDDDDTDTERDEKEVAEEANRATKESLGLPDVPQGAFLAELAKWDGADFKAGNEEAADKAVAALNGVTWTVTKIEQKDRNERPQPPFITSTLQQQANIRLRFPSGKTMQTAQQLYEGVELGSEGSIALITYMRTDSTRVSNEALSAVRGLIGDAYGEKYLPAKPHSYASGKSAQEAHEAIRPTDLSYTPERVRPFLSPDQYRLYTLIYNRFVASQMAHAVFAVTNVEVAAGPGLFKAQGKIEKFDGYRRVLPSIGKQTDTILPPLSERQVLDRLDLIASQHFTQPPPRFNEASLVKALEKEGVGRPSTYASIIATIQARNYVQLENRRFFATELGKIVTELLKRHFPRIMDIKFTSQIEEDLDEIETGRTQYESVLNDFWSPFQQALTTADEKMEEYGGQETGETCPKCGQHPLVKKMSKKVAKPFVGCAGYPECRYIKREDGEGGAEPEETDFNCPVCGKTMLKKSGKKGEFLSCSGYPDCKTTMNIGEDGQPVITAQPTEHKCSKCGSVMLRREGKRGPFLACSGYPKCKATMNLDADGNPVPEIDTGEKCEKCESPMLVKDSRRGPFLACSGYPKCRNSKPLTQELKDKLKDKLPASVTKPPLKVEVEETCPECGSAKMFLRMGRGAPFLGCATYPKCKGTQKVDEEMLARVKSRASVDDQKAMLEAGV